MNRSEYANAIRDLLAVEVDATALLPADETAEGVDTMGGALALAPALFDRYLAAGRSAATYRAYPQFRTAGTASAGR